MENDLVTDLVAFLKHQPDHVLRATKLDEFYREHPRHKGTGIKLKALAGKHPDRLRWVHGASEGLHKIMLAGATGAPSSPEPTAHVSADGLAVQLKQLIAKVTIPAHGWTGSKLDKEYRARFAAQEGWWRAHGYDSAAAAFKAFPTILAVKSGSKGTHFIKPSQVQEQPELRGQANAPAETPKDAIARNLLTMIPVAPGDIEIGRLGSQYMSKFKVSLTQALGSTKLSIFLHEHPRLRAIVTVKSGIGPMKHISQTVATSAATSTTPTTGTVGTRGVRVGPVVGSKPSTYKTKMCPKGTSCANKKKCSFAHGNHELRSADGPSQAGGPFARNRSKAPARSEVGTGKIIKMLPDKRCGFIRRANQKGRPGAAATVRNRSHFFSFFSLPPCWCGGAATIIIIIIISVFLQGNALHGSAGLTSAFRMCACSLAERRNTSRQRERSGCVVPL